MDNIDNVIEKIMKKQIYEPKEFEEAILMSFEANKQHKIEVKNILIKFIYMVIALITITTGVVFAKDISSWIYNIFNPSTTSRGIINMTKEGYLYNIEMEYIESDGNAIKIENIIMDDYNLDIVFTLKTKEKIENISNIKISDLIIADENRNLVFCDYNNIKEYEKYCKKNNIEYSSNNMHNNFTNDGYSIEIIEKNENNIKFLYKMYANQYPKSKKLKFEFNNINMVTNVNEVMDISGKWSIEIDLPEEFYNRKLVTYTVKDNSDKNNNVIVKSAIGGNTEMQIDIIIQKVLEPIEEDDIKRRETEVEKRIDSILGRTSSGNEIIENPILENTNNKQFNITTSGKEDSFSKVYKSNGDIDVHMCFDITKNEYTDNLKLSLQVNGKFMNINLSK